MDKMSTLEQRIQQRKKEAGRNAREEADRNAEAKKNVKTKAETKQAERQAFIKRLEERRAKPKKQQPPPTDNERLTALAPTNDSETPCEYIGRLQILIKKRQIALTQCPADKDKLNEEIRILQWGVDEMYKLFCHYKQFTIE